MEQGFVENLPLVNNLNVIEENRGYSLTRDNNLNIVATPLPGPIIANINDVEQNQTYLLTRDNEGDVSVVPTLPPLISNINEAEENRRYEITRDGDNNVVIAEAEETIRDLRDVEENRRYHITRRSGNISIVVDASLQLPFWVLQQDVTFGILKRQNNYSLTRAPAIVEYLFETPDLQFGHSFNVFERRMSRGVHVCNLSGKLVKLGLTHLNLSNIQGLINKRYRFIITVNGRDIRTIAIDNRNGTGSNRSRTVDTESLNIFVSGGDTLGLSYRRDNGGNTGNFCQVRLTFDTNSRRENFGNFHLP